MNKDLYWPLGITLTLVFFVLFLVGTVLFSRTVPVNLVSENYYEHSLNFQQHLDTVERTAALSDGVRWEYLAAENALDVQIPAANTVVGAVHLSRPSDANMDRHLPLIPDADGQQRIELAGLSKGLWRVSLSWKTDGEAFFAEEVLVIR